MIYLLDTSALSDLMAKRESCLAKLASLPESDQVAICAVTRGEILYGLERLPVGQRRNLLVSSAETLFAQMPCFPVDQITASHYARIKHVARSLGKSLAENDLWIAAVALQMSATLVATDQDFHRLPGVQSSVWTR